MKNQAITLTEQKALDSIEKEPKNNPSSERNNRRPKRGNIFACYKIVDDGLVYRGVCYNIAHVARAIDSYSANVGKYISGDLNTLEGYVVVEVPMEIHEFCDSKDLLNRAMVQATARYNRIKLAVKISDINKLSDEQVAKIKEIFNNKTSLE